MKEYQDYFFKKAKKEGVLSRAFFKLEEIDKKHRLMGKESAILDLGCSPGSWMQYAARQTGESGCVVGVDKVPPANNLPRWVHVVCEDLLSVPAEKLLALAGRKFDVVLSDAAPSTTGERFVDQQNSLRLVERVLKLSRAVLKPGGHLVIKVFQGPDTKKIWDACRVQFEEMLIEKPQSSRKESFEVYWVALRRKDAGPSGG